VEYGTFERVGGSQPVRVDVRIVGATNANLPGLAGQGRFKQDLLDRLSFEVLFLPPLRERREDILLLASHFAARMANELGSAETPTFGEEAIAALENYPWPGNVRELKNVVERAVYRSDSSCITEVVFDPFKSPFVEAAQPTEPGGVREPLREAQAIAPVRLKSFKEAVEDLERTLIYDALQRSNYNQKRAATLLELTYDQFRGYYRKYMRASDPAD
jgi:psp operon transcriptional activator